MHYKMILRASFLFENFFTKTDILVDALFNALKRFFTNAYTIQYQICYKNLTNPSIKPSMQRFTTYNIH